MARDHDIRTLMGKRLRAAREAADLSQSAAAAELDVARQTLARVERGEAAPDGAQLALLADLYGRPVTYFYDLRDPETFRVAFRADHPELLDSTFKQGLLDRLSAIADLEAAAGADRVRGLPPTEPLDKAGARELEHVRAVAREERGRLGLGDRAPVSDIVALLESIDVRVVPFELEPVGEAVVSGFSAFGDGLGSGVFVNAHSAISFERQTFSIAHEYGHLIFHRHDYRGPGETYRSAGRWQSSEEKIANTFAGELLVPGAALRQLVPTDGSASVTDILRLKRIFRVSFAAILTRLHQERLLSRSAARPLWGLMKARGWDRDEPEPLRDGPIYGRRLQSLARRAWVRGEASAAFIQTALGLTPTEVRDLLHQWEADARETAPR